MKILNLYAGIGGNRKLWKDVQVTAVELNSEIAKSEVASSNLESNCAVFLAAVVVS